MANMPITTTSKNEEHGHSDRQTLLDIYIHDYLIKKKCYSTAKAFRTERKLDSILRHGTSSEANGFLLGWWPAFWDVYFATKRQPPHSSLLSQVGPAQDFGAKPPTADPQKELKAEIRKYLDDERNIIPENFQKLLDDEVFKTPLEHPTPSLENFQSSKQPIIVIDDDEEEEDQEGRTRLDHNEDLSFYPEELLKLLGDD